MPPRSKVYELPQAVREELNDRLVGSGFGNYVELSKWLLEQGYHIGKSALHAYGQDLETEFTTAMAEVRKTTEMARVFAEADPDQPAALVDATTRIVQEALLRIALSLRQAEDDPQNLTKPLSQVSRALADLGRVSLAQKKWADELNREVEAKTLAAAAERIDSAAQARGLSAEDARFWRERVLMGM